MKWIKFDKNKHDLLKLNNVKFRANLDGVYTEGVIIISSKYRGSKLFPYLCQNKMNGMRLYDNSINNLYKYSWIINRPPYIRHDAVTNLDLCLNNNIKLYKYLLS